MIPQIKEINFPAYATLSQATVTLNDMGEKTISAQVKIDGSIAPDFSFDWEVEFQGERYIQPLREPQASKGNESICSVIDLTFYHKTIYDLKRYFFVEMASTGSGTAMADKYIADLNVNLGEFKVALQNVLNYYHEIGYLDEPITINLNPEWEYAEEKQYVQIQYTHIWDVVQKIYDLFGVRWSIEGREIKIGYPTEEVAHTFEYGFEGGLLKVERQVQSADIRNSLLGRGGSKNLPYRYFKETDPKNPSFKADPDAIPELADIYFSELRGKTFRDYVKGWKAKRYGGIPMDEPTEAYLKGYTDTAFNPIEFVEDKDSIGKYGLLQGGLENQEDIYPTIQGVEVDGLGRVDEIVGAEEVLVDEPTSNINQNSNATISIFVEKTENKTIKSPYSDKCTFVLTSDIYRVPKGHKGVFSQQWMSNATESAKYTSILKDINSSERYIEGYLQNSQLNSTIKNVVVYEANTHTPLNDINIIPDDIDIYLQIEVEVNEFITGAKFQDVPEEIVAIAVNDEREITVSFETILDCSNINGTILGNFTDGDERISLTKSIDKGESETLTLNTLEFEVPDDGATNIDVPINIIVDKSGEGLYEFEKTIKAVNVDTNEVISSINIPKGKYYLRVSVDIRNNSTSTQTYKVELMPSYIYSPTDSEEFKPTFDIWIKNIWNTTRNAGESDQAYVDRVWTPILGDREGNEAKVVFTTGWLAGHSGYEFVIRDVEYAGGSGVELGGVPAEWKITLIKSDAELEATGKWIPSTTQQAVKGDKFFFIGIDMPHEYTLWAEQAVDNYKADKLLETAYIKPTWVVQTDKVRLNQLQPNETEPLLNALKIGNSLRLADTRFTNGIAQTLYLQSVTYNWQEGTNIVPDVEVVLSDKVTTSTNPVAKLQGEVDALTKQVGSISNIQQVVRAVGDRLYLRKDGATEEVSTSRTKFANTISSKDYRQGAVGGNGWGLRSEQGKGIIEVDKLIVRDEMQVNNLVVNQVSAIGGKEIFSAASIVCSKVDVLKEGFKCYFDTKQGSVANLFVVNDIAYSQVYNPHDVSVKYYKREVIEVGTDYILLSLESDGDGAPQAGDVIVQYGNTELQNRQFVIVRDVIGGGYERMIGHLDDIYSGGSEYYFAGRMNGSNPRWFVGDTQQFAKFEDGKIAIECKQVGMTSEGSSADTVRIWAGADNTHKETAPFRVQQDGKVIASNAVIQGEVNANSGTIGNMSITKNGLEVTNETSGNIGINDGSGVFVINRKLLSDTLGTASFGKCGFAAVESIVGIDGRVCIAIPNNTDSKAAAYLAAAENGNYAFVATSGQFLGLRTKTRVIAEDSRLSTTDYNILVNAEYGSTIILTLPDGEERIDGQEYIIETLGADVTIHATHKVYDHETQTVGKTLTLTNRGVFRLKYYHREPAYPFHWTLVWIAKY